MRKQQHTTNFLTSLIFNLVLIVSFLDAARALSDKRLCADENCKEIISMGVGLINYQPGENGMVSFKMNSPIRIKSKSAGNDPSLWGVEVNGRQGYAPKKFIREIKVIKGEEHLKYLVDVKPPTEPHVLSTSEKFAEKEINMENTTTKPLNLSPVSSSESPLKNTSEEKLTKDTAPVATPVMHEIVNGTKIPVFDNDSNGIAKNLSDKIDVDSMNKLVTIPEGDNKVVKIEADDSGETAPDNNSAEITKTSDAISIFENNKDIKVSTEDVKNEPEQVQNDNVSDENKFVTNEKPPVNEEKNPQDLRVKDKSTERNDNVIREDVVSDQPINEHANADLQAKSENLTVSSLEQNVNNAGISPNNNSTTATNQINIDFVENKSSDVARSPEHVPEIDEQKKENVQEVPQKNNETVKHNLETGKIDEEKKTIVESSENDDSDIKILHDKVVSIDGTSDVKITELFIKQQNDHDIQFGATGEEGTANIHKVSEETTGIHPNEGIMALELDKIDPASSSNTDEQVTEEMLSEEEVVTEHSFQTTVENSFTEAGQNAEEISSQIIHSASKAIEENKISNNDVAPSNSDSSNNHQNAQMEQMNKKDTPNLPTVKEDLKNTSSSIIEPDISEFVTSPNTDEEIKSSDETLLKTEETVLNTTDNMADEALTQKKIVEEHYYATRYSSNSDYITQKPSTTNIPPSDNFGQDSPPLQEHEHTTASYSIISVTGSESTSKPLTKQSEESKPLPSSTHPNDNFESRENKGLFATIMGTVNNMLSINKKTQQNELNGDLDFLFSNRENGQNVEQVSEGYNLEYCKNIGPNGDCPETEQNHEHSTSHIHNESNLSPDFTLETFLQILASKILDMSELLAILVLIAVATLLFIFGYYCFCNSSREGALLLNLNKLESSLLATYKENDILKYNLLSTRQKLASIEDSSFGSNEMVASLKNEIEAELLEKARLQEQVTLLQKELENAADAGIELNKIVSELLSNQTGDESIISSVEELQKQLNEQQSTILEINASLAEKSRENSELQLLIAEQNARYETELANIQRDNDELEHEKSNLLAQLDEMKIDFDKDISSALEGKNLEIKRLQNEIVDLNKKLESEHTKWQTSVAKAEALEVCLKNMRRDPNVNIAEVIDVVNVKAVLIETQKKCTSLKEKLETEMDCKKLAENQLEMVSLEVERLKQDFNQSEKDKLEAQTRLEVLSNYFKDKENQLQKELSLKEAMWLKQQGETTTTVDRVTAMQDEIQSLKSQNDSLRAEIEAQAAAHKAQTGTLENRAHETWLAARQSDRRYEEARAEATALRRKLTALAGANVNDTNKTIPGPVGLGEDLIQAPSPIHMESPGSPMLGRMPPPPFLPPPFMGPPPPFMGMPPPPPFVPPGEMRPAPLGRIMSPPPQRSARFSPQHLDYEDYLDYEGNNAWHRHAYSPPPRTYRSLSPTDSRYNYGTERDLMSTYDTETDFSPPPSPRETRRRGGNSSERIDSNSKISYGNTKKLNMSNKGLISSGSEKSFTSPSHNDNRIRKGNTSLGGKALV